MVIIITWLSYRGDRTIILIEDVKKKRQNKKVPTYTHTYENTHKRTSALLENHTIKGKASVPISKIIQGLDRTIPLLGLRSVHGQITLVSLRRNLSATDGKAYVYIVHYAQTNQFPKSITLSTCPRTLCTLRKVMIKMTNQNREKLQKCTNGVQRPARWGPALRTVLTRSLLLCFHGDLLSDRIAGKRSWIKKNSSSRIETGKRKKREQDKKIIEWVLV